MSLRSSSSLKPRMWADRGMIATKMITRVFNYLFASKNQSTSQDRIFVGGSGRREESFVIIGGVVVADDDDDDDTGDCDDCDGYRCMFSCVKVCRHRYLFSFLELQKFPVWGP